MSTSIVSPPTLQALPSLPWEAAENIYSFCDQETLVSLSLVSFGSWELAGPILYETVEIKSLDGLASLLLLEDIPSSSRLRSSTSLLSRIRILILDIQSLHQNHAPYFDIRQPAYNDDPSYDPTASTFLVPRRLNLLSNTLPIDHLLLPDFFVPTHGLQTFLPTQIFGLLHVRTLTLGVATTFPQRPDWISVMETLDPRYVREWPTFERVVMNRFSPGFGWQDEEAATIRLDDTLVHVWARAHSSKEEKKPFELVFDFASSAYPFNVVAGSHERSHAKRPRMVVILNGGGVLKEVVELLDLRVVVRVKRAEEEEARDELEKDLVEWMKPLVVVESV